MQGVNYLLDFIILFIIKKIYRLPLDHYLLIAKCKPHLKHLQPRLQRPSPFNVQPLKDANTAVEFQLELRNCFQLLAEEGNNGSNENSAKLWDELKEAVVGATESKIGRRRGGFKERCISDCSWELINQCRLAKSVWDQVVSDPHAPADQLDRAMATYRDLARQVKRSYRRDKREWIEAKGMEAQEAADWNDTRTLYCIVRDLTGGSWWLRCPNQRQKWTHPPYCS